MRNFYATLLGLGFVFILTTAFNNAPTVTSEIETIGEQTLVFNTDGLYYAEFYDYIFRGHFEHIEMTREDSDFLMIFDEYLRAYGRHCDQYLPADKVKIMKQVCSRVEVNVDLYGAETRDCMEWEWVPTGLFARPDLYDAKMEVEGIHRAKSLQTMMAMITDTNAMGNSVDMMHKAKGLKNDMAQILSLNPCTSAGVKRFEENLKLFALQKPAIRMQGSSKYAAMKKSGGPTGAQDLKKLFDDLVANQASTWAFNKYVAGSISGLTVLQSDPQGRPAVVKANYNYMGFGSSPTGWVQINFTQGLPKCMYFFDFPQNCKTPNSSIVASYAQGNYGK